MQPTIANNILFYGDKLPILREHIPAESVDLVSLYIRTSLGTVVVLCGLHLDFGDTYSTSSGEYGFELLPERPHREKLRSLSNVVRVLDYPKAQRRV